MTVALSVPNVAKARLPQSYESAKQALATCSEIDECKEWADKAEALASYAKQAGDESLRKTADRIQARAIRRCGELLKQVESAKGGNRGNAATGGRPSIAKTRSQTARDAGLSSHQTKTALRVASVPTPLFERAVESDNPPTVTKLAEHGTQKKPTPLIPLEGRDPRDFKACTAALGLLREMHKFVERTDASAVVRGASQRELAQIAERAPEIISWLQQLQTETRKAR